MCSAWSSRWWRGRPSACTSPRRRCWGRAARTWAPRPRSACCARGCWSPRTCWWPPRGWLESVQNEDGGWGEDQRSYQDPSWAGKGAST
ncbi:hypothetical protein, partial [Streptomyces sp. NPDC031705]|uniref:hypothetical protein n=1 Tax=Streptomyces sp. NPDC031705 TaxID=3155729 RepID=UPI0033FA8329